MTVLRREDVQSKVASWDGCPYRIVRSPILAFVPLIIRRLRRPFTGVRIDVRPWRTSLPRIHRARLFRRHRRLECGPQETRELACDRYDDLGRWLVLVGQASESTTQALLCLIRNRHHPAWLSFPSFRQGDADAWAMLIMPRECGA